MATAPQLFGTLRDTEAVRGNLSLSVEIGDVTLTSPEFATWKPFSATDFPISIEISSANGLVQERVWAISHIEGSQTISIIRGQDETTALAWDSGSAWKHNVHGLQLNNLTDLLAAVNAEVEELKAPTSDVGFNGQDLTNVGAIRYVSNDVTADSADTDLDAATNAHKITLEADTQIGFSNIPESPTAILVWLRQDGTGSRAVTWSGVSWVGGSAPTIEDGANEDTFVSLIAWDTVVVGFPTSAGAGGGGGGVTDHGSLTGLADADHPIAAITGLQAALDAKPNLIDEDDMSSDSATQVPSQQSVKAYVDANSGGGGGGGSTGNVGLHAAPDEPSFDAGNTGFVPGVASIGSPDNFTLTANEAVYQFFAPMTDLTLDDVILDVNNAGTGTTVRVAVVELDDDWQPKPTGLIGQATVDPTTIGTKVISAGWDVDSGKLYALIIVSDGTVQLETCMGAMVGSHDYLRFAGTTLQTATAHADRGSFGTSVISDPVPDWTARTSDNGVTIFAGFQATSRQGSGGAGGSGSSGSGMTPWLGTPANFGAAEGYFRLPPGLGYDGAAISMAVNADRLYYTPFKCAADITISAIGFDIAANTSATEVRVGLVKLDDDLTANATGLVGQTLVGSLATGLNEATGLSWDLDKDEIYAFVFVADGACSYSVAGVVDPWLGSIGSPLLDGQVKNISRFRKESVGTSAFSDPVTDWDTVERNNGRGVEFAILCRYAATV